MIEKVSYKNSLRAIKAVDVKCNRCMSDHIAIAEKNHQYCEDCYDNQIMSDYLYLERYERNRKHNEHILNLNFEFAKSQIKGSSFIKNCYNNNLNGYLHAVCGAGKTEMCLETILESLNNEKSVIFVIPRVEIIKQLDERFRSYFPKTKICALYQDMPFDESADIFISTPHQLIKFFHEFDLMIIDEVDAFPYYQNEYLYRLVNKALKPNATLIYISATMPDDYKKMINSNKMKYCLIPNRFHQQDLVIPSFRKYNYVFSNQLLMNIARYHIGEKKLLVYFPSIHLMSKYKWFLTKQNIKSEMISSQTIYKNMILKKFGNKECNILLTTTLLERGVTFSNCDVFVLETDHSVFNKDTLIQIAGRVGRDKSYTSGDLIFLSRFITIAMREAKRELIKMNKVKNNDM